MSVEIIRRISQLIDQKHVIDPETYAIVAVELELVWL